MRYKELHPSPGAIQHNGFVEEVDEESSPSKACNLIRVVLLASRTYNHRTTAMPQTETDIQMIISGRTTLLEDR